MSGSFGGGILSRLKKAGGDSFGGTELLLAAQSKSDNCRAAGRRPGEAWGSLSGRLAARIFWFSS